LTQNEKKYPCVFGLKDECEARKIVEESEPVVAKSSVAEKAMLEKVMEATKGLQFDDKKVAKEIGEAMAEGAVGKMLPALFQNMKPTRAMILRDFCIMCPDLTKERMKSMPCPTAPRPPPPERR